MGRSHVKFDVEPYDTFVPRFDPFGGTAANRFSKAYAVDESSGCWEWTKALNKDGYGRLHVGSRTNGTNRSEYAYRVGYEFFRGPIPKGMVIDHLCRNRSCVNPNHLEVVTYAENCLRSPIALASINKDKTHCINGHEYTPESTYIYKSGPHKGARHCRPCAADYIREHRKSRAKKAA